MLLVNGNIYDIHVLRCFACMHDGCMYVCVYVCIEEGIDYQLALIFFIFITK